jgi:hypothetical protein
VKWKEGKKHLFRFASKRNKAKKRLFRFALKWNEKIESETKRNGKFFEAKQSEKYGVLILLNWKRKFEAKKAGRSKKNFRGSMQNACETDLVSLQFALKQKIFFCETGAP